MSLPSLPPYPWPEIMIVVGAAGTFASLVWMGGAPAAVLLLSIALIIVGVTR